MGSGNIGATNVLRTAGGKAGIVVLVLDIFKGFFAVWLAGIYTHNHAVAIACAAVAVMLGHCYPIYLRFRGGKGVACFIGAFFYIAPLALLASMALFIAVVAITRYVSVASMIAAAMFPVFLWLISRPPEPILIASFLAALLIISRHKPNIIRLRNGTEHVFSWKRDTTAPARFAQRVK